MYIRTVPPIVCDPFGTLSLSYRLQVSSGMPKLHCREKNTKEMCTVLSAASQLSRINI